MRNRGQRPVGTAFTCVCPHRRDGQPHVAQLWAAQPAQQLGELGMLCHRGTCRAAATGNQLESAGHTLKPRPLFTHPSHTQNCVQKLVRFHPPSNPILSVTCSPCSMVGIKLPARGATLKGREL